MKKKTHKIGKQRRLRADSKIGMNRLQRKKHLTPIKINFQVWDEEEKKKITSKMQIVSWFVDMVETTTRIHIRSRWWDILCDIMSCSYTHTHTHLKTTKV